MGQHPAPLRPIKLFPSSGGSRYLCTMYVVFLFVKIYFTKLNFTIQSVIHGHVIVESIRALARIYSSHILLLLLRNTLRQLVASLTPEAG